MSNDTGKGIAILGIWLGATMMSFAVASISPVAVGGISIMAMLSTFIVTALWNN